MAWAAFSLGGCGPRTATLSTDTLKETTTHKPEPKAPEKKENDENSEMKRPERPGPGASSVEIWEWMEEFNTYNQIEAIKAAPRRPPKPPYVPKDEQPPPPKPSAAAPSARPESEISLPKSTEWYRELIKLGSRIAEQEARRMLALKTQKVWSKMGKSGPPPDMWSRLEEAERYRRPPKLSRKNAI
jgi:hypothetical protein